MTDAIGARFTAGREIIAEAGAASLQFFRNRDALTIEHKGPQDLVSRADREVEELIRARIAARFPDDAILGEEGGHGKSGREDSPVWVIDPIDGTACFLAGLPSWCVSVALVAAGDIAFGFIEAPLAGERFSARKGHGAHLNDAPIRVSKAGDFTDGLFALGHSQRRPAAELLDFLVPLLANGGAHYCNGSAALMLASVAAGRLIGYYEAHINSWDCLAGLALVREAGGWTNDFLADEGLVKGNAILATAPGISGPARRIARL